MGLRKLSEMKTFLYAENDPWILIVGIAKANNLYAGKHMLKIDPWLFWSGDCHLGVIRMVNLIFVFLTAG